MRIENVEREGGDEAQAHVDACHPHMTPEEEIYVQVEGDAEGEEYEGKVFKGIPVGEVKGSRQKGEPGEDHDGRGDPELGEEYGRKGGAHAKENGESQRGE